MEESIVAAAALPHRRWTGIRSEAREAFFFTYNNAASCAFAVWIFLWLGLTRWIAVPGIARYDLMLLLCLAFQAFVVRRRIETVDELKVICVFHLLGLSMEIVKVHYGSWSYPGPGVAKVLGVPLFSGFMYASVASFMCQAWRRFDLVMVRWPRPAVAVPIAAAIYGNFFTNLFVPDLRWAILPALFLAFGRTWVEYTPCRVRRRMPILVTFGLIAFFIWLAENIGTFLSAWRYPSQHHGWRPVYLQKLSSWYLLVIVSLLIVVELKRTKLRRMGQLVPGRIGHA
ncbi:MAG TPA: DUF817 domain-containing protein [Planctomycetota bacterium]|nr:DUF817 domain-containing protein [Planctomycetota bacterium]